MFFFFLNYNLLASPFDLVECQETLRHRVWRNQNPAPSGKRCLSWRQGADSLMGHMEKWPTVMRKQCIIEEETIKVREKPSVQPNPFRHISSSMGGALWVMWSQIPWPTALHWTTGSMTGSAVLLFKTSRLATDPQRQESTPLIHPPKEHCPWSCVEHPNDTRLKSASSVPMTGHHNLHPRGDCPGERKCRQSAMGPRSVMSPSRPLKSSPSRP